MGSFKRGIPIAVAVAVLASLFGGCASTPTYHEYVIIVPIPVPGPGPCPLPPDYPTPPPTETLPPTERPAPLDRNSDPAAPVTKTHELRPSPTPVRPQAEPVADDATPVRVGNTGRDGGRSGGRR